MKRTKALLLAAGLGTRLRPLTESIPKCLVPIAGRPLIDYWVDLLNKAGVQEGLINTHASAGLVRGHVERINRRGSLTLTESHEPQLLGSAGTIAANPDLADDADEVIIIYADNLSDADLRLMLERHRRHEDPVTMLLFHTPDPQACGIVELDQHDRVVSFFEKPRHPQSTLANAGLYIVDAEAYREMATSKAFDLATDVLPRFVGRMRGWVTDGYHRDIGTPRTYVQAQDDARRRFIDGHHRRPAVFLDRDGTLIEHVHYLSDPAQVRLVSHAAGVVQALRRAGFACVVVSNQSAIGRGLISEDMLDAIHAEMVGKLAESGAELDGIYHCPVMPKIADRTVVEHLDRKPGPGMLWQAAEDLELDVGRSWMVGDSVSDVLAGRNAGCAGSILVGSAQNDLPIIPNGSLQFHAVTHLSEAADRILTETDG